MTEPSFPRLELDGRSPGVEDLRALVMASYGHFTAMQVRDRRVRGLALHLSRLDEANRELFGAKLDGEHVCDLIRHALADTTDASVRVHVQSPEPEQPPAILVIVRPAGAMPGTVWRLRSVPYQRSVAHIKRIGDFGQGYYQRLVQRDGFDEALLTGPDGSISEGSITNVGFFDGSTVVWPAAPLLSGITMQLLEAGLASRNATSRRDPIHLSDVDSFTGAFAANSRGIIPVGQIDDHVFAVDPRQMSRLAEVYESSPWDEI